MQLILLTFFGVIGIWLRYGIGLLADKYLHSFFPYHTLTINTLGSFLIGIVYVIGMERSYIPPDVRVALMVGLLGGFTTFSALSLEATRLVEQHMIAVAVLYLILSAVFGVVATASGIGFARLFMMRF